MFLLPIFLSRIGLFADRGVGSYLQGSRSRCHVNSHLGQSDGNSLSG